MFLLYCLSNRLSCVVMNYKITQGAYLCFQVLGNRLSYEAIDYPKLQILLSFEIGLGTGEVRQSINSMLLAKFQVEVSS